MIPNTLILRAHCEDTGKTVRIRAYNVEIDSRSVETVTLREVIPAKYTKIRKPGGYSTVMTQNRREITVKRNREITVKYMDQNKESRTLRLSGDQAISVQQHLEPPTL